MATAGAGQSALAAGVSSAPGLGTTGTGGASGMATSLNLAKDDYFVIVDQEEGELLAHRLIEEILSRGQEVIFEKHIESQVLPYAVHFAKETLLTFVQWEHFRRDPCVVDHVAWSPDEEPLPAIIDSWARAAVPFKKPPPTIPAATQKRAVDNETSPIASSRPSQGSASSPGRRISGAVPSSAAKGASISSLAASNKDGTTGGKKNGRSDFSLASSSSSKLAGKGYRQPVRRSQGHGATSMGNGGSEEHPLTAAAAAEHAIMEENRRMAARIQNIEADGGKTEFGFDSDGRLVMVKKAAYSKLLTHGVKAKVLDPAQPPQAPNSTLTSNQPSSRQPRSSLPAVPEARFVPPPPPPGLNRWQQPYPHTLGRKLSKSTVTTLGGSLANNIAVGSLSSVATLAPSSNGFLPDTSLDIPLLIDTIKLQQGVTLREGEAIKVGGLGPPEGAASTKHRGVKLRPRKQISTNPAEPDGATLLPGIHGTFPVSQNISHANRQSFFPTPPSPPAPPLSSNGEPTVAPRRDPLLAAVLSKAKPIITKKIL